MGGRGTDLEPSGKALKAIRITLDDGRVLSYRTHENGRVTDIDNFGDEKNVNGLSLSQIRDNARKQGHTVESFTESQLKKIDEARSQRREAQRGVDYELGLGVPWGNRENRRRARLNRIADRAMRRR